MSLASSIDQKFNQYKMMTLPPGPNVNPVIAELRKQGRFDFWNQNDNSFDSSKMKVGRASSFEKC